jgi:hypothetical protein
MALQKLEQFSFATALDLSIGYYTIRLGPDVSKIYTIIFPWGTSYYQWVLQVPQTFSKKECWCLWNPWSMYKLA